MSKFINTELKSDSESDSELVSERIGTKVDNKLMAKLEKSGSDSEKDILRIRFCLCLYFWQNNFLAKLCLG